MLEETKRILFEALTISAATTLLAAICFGLAVWAFMEFGGGEP